MSEESRGKSGRGRDRERERESKRADWERSFVPRHKVASMPTSGMVPGLRPTSSNPHSMHHAGANAMTRPRQWLPLDAKCRRVSYIRAQEMGKQVPGTPRRGEARPAQRGATWSGGMLHLHVYGWGEWMNG